MICLRAMWVDLLLMLALFVDRFLLLCVSAIAMCNQVCGNPSPTQMPSDALPSPRPLTLFRMPSELDPAFFATSVR